MKKFTFGANKKINFIRIPKNASTSIYNFFGVTNTIRNEYFDSDNKIYQNFFESSHCKISSAVDRLGEKILNLPTLAIKRNPYDRMVSMYFFTKKHKIDENFCKFKINSFLEFCQFFEKQSKDPNFFHAWDQYSFIEKNGNILATDILEFNNLSEEFPKFLAKYDCLSYFRDKPLLKQNFTTHENFQKYYCAKSKIIIKNIWGQDLNYFKYSI